MSKENRLHKQITDKENTLTSAQEVTYQKEFNKADEVMKDESKEQNNKEH